MSSTLKLMTLSFMLLISLSNSGQNNFNNSSEKYKNLPKGTVVYNFMMGDSVSHTRIELPDSLKRYIVEFTEAPLYAGQDPSTLKSVSLYNDQRQKIDLQHNQFLRDLSRLSGVNANNLKSTSVSGGTNQLGKEFRKVFNGVSLTADKNLVSQIEQLGYVKKVHPDNMVEVVDDESNHVIKADSVRQQYGATGKGITIAIIDTGIDSTHQDLSNGKVIGGYDFVNNDNNPLDDHGHGTHCAGIAAAKGPGLTGVAPDAKLLAVKVLNEWGSGYDSWIIAGIEYALDPDGNPSTDDGADIISMSLGSPNGNPNDPMSQAINNAFKRGVLCVVAAGNNGSNYNTIDSPGCAKEALTVGASDNNDYLGYFSSRGPVLESYEIKPNVLAPGVNIYSSLPNGRYENWNGTSMATPHVAGAAALLKEIHPNWNASTIRSAIVHTAKDIMNGNTIWSQGNGRIDLMKAAASSTSISKNSINFGIIPDNIERYTRTDSFYVFNNSESNKNYQLEVVGDLPSEIALSLSLDHFSLAPSDSQLVLLTFDANNKTLIYPSDEVPAFTGRVTINDGSQELKLLFSVIKSYCLNLKFDYIPGCVEIINTSGFYKYYYPNQNNLSILLPNGKYDIILWNSSSYIVREQVDISNQRDITISIKDAKYKATFRAYGPDGNPLRIFDSSPERFVLKSDNYSGFRLSKFTIWNGTTFPPIEKYFSEFSDRYRYEIAPMAFPHTSPDHTFYTIPFRINDPLTKDTIFYNDPNDFVKIEFNHNAINGMYDSLYYAIEGFSSGIGGYYNLWDVFDTTAHIMTPPFKLSKYVTPAPDENFSINDVSGYWLYKLRGKMDTNKDTLIYCSANIECYKDSGETFIRHGSYRNTQKIDTKNRNITIFQNIGPLLSTGQFGLDMSSKKIIFNKEAGYFLDQSFGATLGKVYLTFTKGSEVLHKDTVLNNFSMTNWETKSIPFEINTNYTLNLKSFNFPVYKKSGYSYQNFHINIPDNSKLSWSDFMYSLRSLNLFSNDIPGNVLKPEGKNEIQFELPTPQYLSVKFYLKENNGKNWKKIYEYNYQEGRYDNKYKFQLPDTLSSDYYSMKISMIASENDSVESFFEPAFYLAKGNEVDSLALVDFYTSTGGKNWKNNRNWLKTRIKDWYGLTIQNDKVIEINLPNNNLTGLLPETLKNISTLKKLNVKENYLFGIGDLTIFNNLSDVDISGNQLTFSDILPNISLSGLIYYPQKKLGNEQLIKKTTGESITINSCILEEDCHYYWYKNSKRIPNNDKHNIDFEPLKQADNGIYTCYIMNESVPELILERYPITIEVIPALFNDKSYLLDNLDVYSYGGSWNDYDNDGDQDLFIVNYNKCNQLLKNMFIETDSVWFKDVTLESIGYDEGSSASATWGDINNDGFIDVFVVNQEYTDPKIIYLNNGDGTFRELNDPVIQSQLRYSLTANWVDFNRDGWLDLYIGNTYHYQLSNNNNQLFINKGNLTFESYQEQNQTLTSSLYNNSVSWFDLDNDTDMDVFVSGHGVDLLYVNNEGSFKWPNNEDSTWIHTGVNGQTNSTGDFDNDGDIDVFSGHGSWYYEYTNEPKNALLENINGKLHPFQDKNIIDDQTNYFSSSWGDFDNDGDLDLLGTSFYGITNLWSNQLQETGKVSFKKIDYGVTAEYLMGSRGAAFADFDNDGDLDIFVDGSQYENHLFENITGNSKNWINIKCIGKTSNTSAIGTKVKIKATINGKPCWQMHEVSSQTGYSGQNSLNVEFGLGDATVIDSLKFYWPSGYYWDTTGVSINQFITIFEKEKPNDIPFAGAFNDTIIYENVPFAQTYQIIDEWNKGIAISVVKKPSWLKYSIQSQSITFTGTPGDYNPGNYNIILSISDGYVKSPVIDTIALIVENVNDAPVILGQSPITLDATGKALLSIDQLMVVDIDNDQEDLFIVILEGEHYTFSNNTVIVDQQFHGNLTVKVQVSDGVSLSAPYNLIIQSNSNDLPCLSPTCKEFNATEDLLFQSELVIIDEKFSQISIVEKSNLGWISISTLANKITLSGTPGNANTGLNKLIVEINDGYLTTPVIDTVLIDVQQVNDAPIITGQNQLTVDGKGYLKILLSDLFVEDVDNVYPVDFNLLIHPGTGYSIAADTVFLQKNDKVFVPVQVNDGQLSSNVFNLEIENFTGIDDVISSDWTIYPIPFYNEVFVKSPALVSLLDIEIFDLQGKRVYPPIVSNEQYLKVDCSGLSQSVYLMRLTTTNSTMVKKLIRGK